jgi:AbrB family looped-hinge helix DNA binding protein
LKIEDGSTFQNIGIAEAVTTKGQITVPKPIRDLLRIVAGSAADFQRTDDGQVVFVHIDEKQPESPRKVERVPH